ncbi:MAG: hypothetical protein M8841_07245 [marine benthic group bacterium]|nr:hypothetical protein [Gemmatimonadota bacterium]MCL7937331.1 hypothetical protein [Gemmatimonadota bacterium]MCL7956922.1 hypothetical protein [Gemmatimonadota bacterium]MCL7967030.1 hypothetical protein [Gemmatimonadota bacterium]MCL7976449.1 hypothetical protein [Gemmatimonadota bacterium]
MSTTAKVMRSGNLVLLAAAMGLFPNAIPARGQETGVPNAERSRERLQDALPPGDLDRIREMAGELGREGIPPQLIRRKAVEGIAKGVPPDRIVGALEDYSNRLREANDLLAAGGMDRRDGASLAATAEAVRRGVSPDAIRSLAGEAGGRGNRGLAVPMLVLGDLAEAGVPADQALDAVREGMRRGTPEQGMLNFSAAVRRRIRMGEDPSAAFDQVRVRAMERMQNDPTGAGTPPGYDGRQRPRNAAPVPPGSEPPRGSDGGMTRTGPN